jgi:hypothetical protein
MCFQVYWVVDTMHIVTKYSEELARLFGLGLL